MTKQILRRVENSLDRSTDIKVKLLTPYVENVQRKWNKNNFVTSVTAPNEGIDSGDAKEALNSWENEEWIKAEKEEPNSVVRNGLPNDMKTLYTKWYLKSRIDPTGQIRRNKVGLVVRGFRRVDANAFIEPSPPVVRYASIRFVCV